MVGHRDTAGSWGSRYTPSPNHLWPISHGLHQCCWERWEGGLERPPQWPTSAGPEKGWKVKQECWKEPICVLAPAWVQGDHQPLLGNKHKPQGHRPFWHGKQMPFASKWGARHLLSPSSHLLSGDKSHLLLRVRQETLQSRQRPLPLGRDRTWPTAHTQCWQKEERVLAVIHSAARTGAGALHWDKAKFSHPAPDQGCRTDLSMTKGSSCTYAACRAATGHMFHQGTVKWLLWMEKWILHFISSQLVKF